MTPEKEPMKVLIVSGSEKGLSYIRQQLPHADFEPVVMLSNAGEAQRLLSDCTFDLVIINTPLSDGLGTEFAEDCADGGYAGVLLIAGNELYEQIGETMEQHGILMLPKPLSRQMMEIGIHSACAMRLRLRREEKNTQSIRAKMDEIRLVNRAKWLLIEKLGMNEPAAHRFIEKQAMDLRLPRGEIARNLIRTYDN